ncbi:MAG: diphosphomevalonate/mevalonate 3,5-bisphosphate decarboxylase family protein [Flavobacteriales bacterium]
MSFNDEVFKLNLQQHKDCTIEGKVSWRSPSNIALVKYWGKKGNQLPANPSVSYTLKNCYTETSVDFTYGKNSNRDLNFLFKGKENTVFKQKIEVFLQKVTPYFPFLADINLTINSSNSFPHSSGIASSASAMSALALCLCSIEEQFRDSWTDADKYRKASFISRIGSGSACRSVYGGLVAWGEHKSLEKSSDYYGIEVKEIHEDFKTYADTVLLIDKGQKKVSSTIGHSLMHEHPFASQRFVQAEHNLSTLLSILKEGNKDDFRKIVESEALSLHAMMMTANPYFILFRPNTIAVIEKIWDFREQTRLDIVFTLDAGANVHILYPLTQKNAINQFVKDELIGYCEKREYICDEIGTGPINLSQTS